MRYILLSTLMLSDVDKLWDKFYNEYFKKYDKQKTMVKPKIRWLKKMTKFKKIGHWYSKVQMPEFIILDTEIALNPRLAEYPEFLELTLIHEMCHQAVTEIDRVSDRIEQGHSHHWKTWMNRCGISDPQRYIDDAIIEKLKTKEEKEKEEQKLNERIQLVKKCVKLREETKQTRKNIKPKEIHENMPALVITADGLTPGMFACKKSVKWVFVPIKKDDGYYLVKVTKNNVFEPSILERNNIISLVNKQFFLKVQELERLKNMERKLNALRRNNS